MILLLVNACYLNKVVKLHLTNNYFYLILSYNSFRVETVLGSDRVIVMSDGKAIEIGHPNLLLQNPDLEFSKHVVANN